MATGWEGADAEANLHESSDFSDSLREFCA